ncbi:MAG: AraC family transcriptional regulator [Clostridia bacterium]|nr:AraC family transcriptional regulator [Clostridia bacterium]
MRDYIIERDDHDEYQNGICFFRQDSLPHQVIIKAHLHNSVEILYIQKGHFTIYVDDKIYHLFAGDAILFRSNTIHYIIAGEEKDSFYYVLKIRPDAIKNLATPAHEEEYALSFIMDRQNTKCVWKKEEMEGSAAHIKDGFNLLINEFGSGKKYADVLSKIATEMILLSMIKNGGNAACNTDLDLRKETAQAIYKATEYITQNFKEDITCQKLCDMLNISYSYFSRTFKAVTGNSFKEYLNIIRINCAENLIMNTNKSATEICRECGFNNAAYFSKVYKSIKGCAPLASRNKKM